MSSGVIPDSPCRPPWPWTLGRRALTWTTLLLLGVAPSLLAHPKLRRSSPAAGDTVTVLSEVALTFDEAVEPAISTLVLLAPDGRRIVLRPRAGAARSELLASVSPTLAPGTYTMEWKVAGGDGHPIRGRFAFTMAAAPSAADTTEAPAGAEGPAPPPDRSATPAPSHHPAESFPASSGFGVNSPAYVVVRWLTFTALLVIIGVLSFRYLVHRIIRRRGASTYMALAAAGEARAATLGLLATLLLLAAIAARLMAQMAAMQDPGEGLGSAGVSGMLLKTTWGWGWLLQVGGAFLALTGFLQARQGKRHGWHWALVAGAILSLTPALSGHAVAVSRWQPLPVLADWLHVLGAGGWLGTLVAILLAGIPAAWQAGPSTRSAAVAELVNAFSPVALACAGLAAVTGLFAAWVHLGTLPALWQSTYGRTLLVKWAVLSVVAATGAYNWRRVRPALGQDPATARLRRSASLELAVAAAVIAITAVLVATPPPTESM